MTEKPPKKKLGRPRKNDSHELALIADEKLRDPSLSIMKAATMADIPIDDIAQRNGTVTDSVRRRLERGFMRDETALMKAAQVREAKRQNRSSTSSGGYGRGWPLSGIADALDQARMISETINALDPLRDFRAMQDAIRDPLADFRATQAAVRDPFAEMRIMEAALFDPLAEYRKRQEQFDNVLGLGRLGF